MFLCPLRRRVFGVQSRSCPAGHSLVRPSVRPGERSHSATPAAVRALCPPQRAALFLPSLLLLTAASSAVSTGCWPTPRSMSCLSHSSSSIHTRMPTPRMHINTVCALIHLKGSHADMQKLSRPCMCAEEVELASLRGRAARVTMRHSNGCSFIPLKEMSVFCWSCSLTSEVKQSRWILFQLRNWGLKSEPSLMTSLEFQRRRITMQSTLHDFMSYSRFKIKLHNRPGTGRSQHLHQETYGLVPNNKQKDTGYSERQVNFKMDIWQIQALWFVLKHIGERPDWHTCGS